MISTQQTWPIFSLEVQVKLRIILFWVSKNDFNGSVFKLPHYSTMQNCKNNNFPCIKYFEIIKQTERKEKSKHEIPGTLRIGSSEIFKACKLEMCLLSWRNFEELILLGYFVDYWSGKWENSGWYLYIEI